MAKMGIVENGLKRRRKARRNPTVAAKVSTSRNPARRSVSLASAKAVVKRNGLKTVSATAANPKRKHHRRRRRNGISAVTITRRNGLLGNTKSDAKQVAILGGGALATKMIGRVVLSFAQGILSSVGVGNYGELIVDGIVALTVTPFIAGKLVKGSDVQKMARLGGGLVVLLDVVEAFAPQALQWNPFTTNPVVMTGSGAAITPSAVAAIAQGVANSLNPQAEAAKVGYALAALQSGQGFANTDSYSDGFMPSPEIAL